MEIRIQLLDFQTVITVEQFESQKLGSTYRVNAV